ncbi:hypothetical protein [Candidatus Pelagadaptatus aseana]|uniref:hypothetical protein n=1 Tax=Candidatus Pelagadaptatus aseana TaxID=3120508 RepID=UPI003C6F4107
MAKKYQAAMEKRSIGDLYSSIDDLNSLLSNNPTLHRARLELAVTYYRAAEYEQAKRHAQQVLSDPNTPEGVRQTVELFLEQIESLRQAESERRHSTQAFIGIGGGYDDNVNAGPGSDTFEFNGLRFFLDPQDGEQSDAFGTISARFNHSYRMPGTADIGSRPVNMLWQSGVSVYRKEYQDEHPYTVDVIGGSTGMAWASRTNWRASLDLKLDYVRLGDDALALYSSLNPVYTVVSGKNEYTLRGQWLYREYMADDDKDREGDRVLFGGDYQRNFTANVAMRLGASLYEQDGRVDYEEFDVEDYYISGFWTAWEGGVLYVRASYRETDYEGLEPVFNVGRREDETRYVLGASHNFKSGRMEGWGISGRVSFSDNESNISIYEYDRTLYSAELTKRF